jgi:hypothetical protein
MIEVIISLLSPPETSVDHHRPPRPPPEAGARVTTDAGDVSRAGWIASSNAEALFRLA